jgi:hypothetical protein
MARLTAVAVAHGKILARRRITLLLLALLPLAFYGALSRHSVRAVTVGGIASAFSAGGAAIFSMLPARRADQRLALAGFRPSALILGRLLVLEALSLVIAVITSVVMILGTGPRHPAETFAGVIGVGVVGVTLGLALGALLPRELEAVIVLIGFVGIQLTARTDSAVSSVLPFHGPAQLLDASAGVASAGVWSRVVLTLGYALVLVAVAWLAWLRRVAVRASRPDWEAPQAAG